MTFQLGKMPPRMGRGISWKPLNRWCAVTPQGMYVCDVDPNDLANSLEEQARMIRSGSEHLKQWPPAPHITIAGVDVPVHFVRSDEQKLDAAANPSTILVPT